MSVNYLAGLSRYFSDLALQTFRRTNKTESASTSPDYDPQDERWRMKWFVFAQGRPTSSPTKAARTAPTNMAPAAIKSVDFAGGGSGKLRARHVNPIYC